MKKTLCVLLSLLLLVSFTACSSGGAAPAKTGDKQDAVDVDLTLLGSTMVYSELFNILSEPDAYIGKRIRMAGQFSAYEAYDDPTDPEPEQVYYSCMVRDSTACCELGLEFVLSGKLKYPQDYPKLGSVITVTGEFQTYYEGETRFAHLVNADLA